MEDVHFQRGDKAILRGVNWQIRDGEHWALVGANGSGKTTLLQIAVGYIWPTRGEVFVLGQHFGEVDLRQLRRRIGWVSASLHNLIRREQKAVQIVLSGIYASTGLFDKPRVAQIRHARELMAKLGCEQLADACYAVLSLGEQQKVLIARAMMASPELLILDEACAGLDLPARENLLSTIDALGQGWGHKHPAPSAANGQADAATNLAPGEPHKSISLILVTHHVEEIPPAFSHVLVLKDGQVLAQGKKADVLTGPVLSDAFNLAVDVEESFGRYWPKIRHAK